MKRLQLTKVIASLLIGFSVFAFNPIKASAYVGQIITADEHTRYADSSQWRYQNGRWMCGTNEQPFVNTWVCTNGSWYYIGTDGYMKTNLFINNYYVNDSGQWIIGATYDGRGNVIYPNTTPATQTSTTTTTTNNNTSVGTINESKDFTQNSSAGKFFASWVYIDGKYYHFNKDAGLNYDTTIDGYEVDYSGAWIEDDSMKAPKVTNWGTGIESAMRQVIQKQQFEAEAHEVQVQNHQSINFTRQQQINDMQDKIDRWEAKGNIDAFHQELIDKYKAEIEKLEKMIERDSE
nr:hypothetical protein [Clostridium chromiireducens]